MNFYLKILWHCQKYSSVLLLVLLHNVWQFWEVRHFGPISHEIWYCLRVLRNIKISLEFWCQLTFKHIEKKDDNKTTEENVPFIFKVKYIFSTKKNSSQFLFTTKILKNAYVLYLQRVSFRPLNNHFRYLLFCLSSHYL